MAITEISLNLLRAFDAAARLGSFTEAAKDLFVTQAAVSHQVKALESWLGKSLFHRTSRGLMLTDERSAEHTSELQSLMRTSYAVFCLKKKNIKRTTYNTNNMN